MIAARAGILRRTSRGRFPAVRCSWRVRKSSMLTLKQTSDGLSREDRSVAGAALFRPGAASLPEAAAICHHLSDDN